MGFASSGRGHAILSQIKTKRVQTAVKVTKTSAFGVIVLSRSDID